MKLILAFPLLLGGLLAQPTVSNATITCVVGEVLIEPSGTTYLCTMGNTWKAIESGGSGQQKEEPKLPSKQSVPAAQYEVDFAILLAFFAFLFSVIALYRTKSV